MPPAVIDALEIRWFDRGELPRPIVDWSRTLPLPPESPQPKFEERIDIYLPTGGAPHLSVKLSRGSLELKERLDAESFTTGARRISGQSENWRKLSWKYAAQDVDGDSVYDALAVHNASDWCEMPKRRWQWKFEVSSSDVEPVRFEARPPFGCAVEIVALDLPGDPWWSIALDTFAPPDSRRATLRAAVDALLSAFPTPLVSDQSYSYAEWLARWRAQG